MGISSETLALQNSVTSAAIIEELLGGISQCLWSMPVEKKAAGLPYAVPLPSLPGCQAPVCDVGCRIVLTLIPGGVSPPPRFKEDAAFKKLAERLMAEIMRRDQEDGDKLAKGIQLAVDKKATSSGAPFDQFDTMG